MNFIVDPEVMPKKKKLMKKIRIVTAGNRLAGMIDERFLALIVRILNDLTILFLSRSEGRAWPYRRTVQD